MLQTVEELTHWKNKLAGWRATLVQELAQLPPARTDKQIGRRDNLTYSIGLIDGYSVGDTVYDLTNLRLGELMREAGYQPAGADPLRHYSGEMPWHGGLPQVDEQLAQLARRAALDAAPPTRTKEEEEYVARQRAVLDAMRITADESGHRLVARDSDNQIREDSELAESEREALQFARSNW